MYKNSIFNLGTIKDCVEFHEFQNHWVCHEPWGDTLVAWCLHDCTRWLWWTEDIIHTSIPVEGFDIQLWCDWALLYMCRFNNDRACTIYFWKIHLAVTDHWSEPSLNLLVRRWTVGTSCFLIKIVLILAVLNKLIQGGGFHSI